MLQNFQVPADNDECPRNAEVLWMAVALLWPKLNHSLKLIL